VKVGVYGGQRRREKLPDNINKKFEALEPTEALKQLYNET